MMVTYYREFIDGGRECWIIENADGTTTLVEREPRKGNSHD